MSGVTCYTVVRVGAKLRAIETQPLVRSVVAVGMAVTHAHSVTQVKHTLDTRNTHVKPNHVEHMNGQCT